MRVYSSEGEASIEGTTKEYFELKLALDNFIASPAISLVRDTEQGVDPRPYDLLLNKLIFSKSGSAVRIRADGSALCLDGSSGNLALLADNLPYGAEESSLGVPYHVHFDHAGWPNEITSDSLELVFCVQRIGS